ncbi:MAG: VanW family protein [Patescibacteria group bacterium]
MSTEDKKDSDSYTHFFIGALLFFAFSLYAFFVTMKIHNTNMIVQASGLEEGMSDEKVGATTDQMSDVSVGTDLLGRAEISYSGGTEGRNKNIELGVDRMNGVIVQPNKEFSFTQTLGAVTQEDGFSEEKVFLNGEVTKGIGGGLCQVSTALFRSVLNAGLPVTARTNHTYSVSYYDVGLDATYSDPGPDFRFVNDTSYPIALHATTENQKVVFEIYGTSDGRVASTTDAEISQIVDFPPTKYIEVAAIPKDQTECINKPQIGYTTKVSYDVLYPTGIEKQHIFTSTYKPLQRVCYVIKS